jgi:GWxTD domain-containing protein
MEPGVFGIFRPVLLLPEGASRNLSAAQLGPIIAHEMFHVRGRDNLAAAMHTVVEALFWFHPLVWWLGDRLVDERERACDEAVLQMGFEPADYAEGILKVCKSNLMMPACVAGVSGSNLKRRIEVIMENRGTQNLNLGKKLLLTFAGAGLLAGPVFAGMMNAAQSPIATVREMQLPVVERSTSAAPPVTPPSSTPQVAPVAIVVLEPKTGAVQAGASAIGGSFIGLNYSTNNFLGYGETISADAQPGTRQSNFVVSVTEPYLQDRLVALLQVAPSPQQTPARPAVHAVTEQQKWLDDVSEIISDAEKKAFQQLTSDKERQGFITNFWLARDPTPGTSANEFKEEYDRRVTYANEHFTTQTGIPGSKTDRGKMYILRGQPDEIKVGTSVSYSYGGTGQGNNFVFTNTDTHPSELWRYRNIDGKAANVAYEFIDRQKNGEYTLEYDPGSKSK